MTLECPYCDCRLVRAVKLLSAKGSLGMHFALSETILTIDQRACWALETAYPR